MTCRPFALGSVLSASAHHLMENRASLAGYLGGSPLYGTAKHGVVGLLRSLKHLATPHKIAISLVAPATTVSPILLAAYQKQDMTPEAYAQEMKSQGVPMNRVESVALAGQSNSTCRFQLSLTKSWIRGLHLASYSRAPHTTGNPGEWSWATHSIRQDVRLRAGLGEDTAAMDGQRNAG